MFFKKIELEKVKELSVKLAIETTAEIEFVSIANDYKTRKEYGVDVEGMAKMVNIILGTFIEARIDHMILEKLIFEYGSKKMLNAYNKYQEQSRKIVNSYYKDITDAKLAKNKSGKKAVLQ